ncbi:MAG: 2Fe-2S iron-sulfur cluster binding domain-containing protein [Magnetococcales bacterium]|nr:2Fe-2S iron-sulfur cluster binding domain-containing protein [Magnetococcales bacterium]
MNESQEWYGWRAFRVVGVGYEDPGCTVRTLRLAPADDEPLASWRPGQFLTLRFEVPDPVSGQIREAVRCYTLSAGPGGGEYRISVKRLVSPRGLVSNHIHDRVQEGDRLLARSPGGGFVLDAGRDPLVLIAGGIGITPMLSMLEANFASREPRETWLFYGARNGEELVRREYLEHLAQARPDFHLRFCLSRPLPQDKAGVAPVHVGHVEPDLVERIPSFAACRYYVCGPTALMAAMITGLRGLGVAEERIHHEAFGPASWLRAVAGSSGQGVGHAVTFLRSGRTLAWEESAESLLEFAENHGIALPCGCRSGACGTCEALILSGAVTYAEPPDYPPEEGHCLPCVARPSSDLALDL